MVLLLRPVSVLILVTGFVILVKGFVVLAVLFVEHTFQGSTCLIGSQVD